MSLGGSSIVSCVPITQLLNMKLFKLLIKISFLPITIILTLVSGIITKSKTSGVEFHSFVIWFKKHINGNYNMLHNLFNLIYSHQLMATEYNIISTNTTKMALKSDAIDIINNDFIANVPQWSEYTAASPESRDIETSLKKEKTKYLSL